MGESGARIGAMDAVCQRCGGTGWILDSADGRKSARPCACRLERTIRERLELSGIPQRFEDRTLDTFLTNNAELTRALERAREFVDRYPFVEGGLLFVGPSGRGKTHLACAILSELIRTKGVVGLYLDSSTLMNRIQTSFRPDADEPREAVVAPYASAELVVLDELGLSQGHPWVLDVLYDLLNTRYNRRKITIVTTNFADEPDPASGTRDRLEDRVGYRVRSRLYEMCVTIPLRGEDFRKAVHSAEIQSGL